MDTYVNAIAIEEDGDEIFIHVTHCQRWECQSWEDGKAIYPKLEQDEDEFWQCPQCHYSYGKQE